VIRFEPECTTNGRRASYATSKNASPSSSQTFLCSARISVRTRVKVFKVILSIANASEATIRGEELEVALRPVSWLGLSANYGHLNARYDRFVIGNINYTGNPLASTPRTKFSFAADIKVPVATLGNHVGAVNREALEPTEPTA